MHVWRTHVKMEGLVWTVEQVVDVSVYPLMEVTSVRQVSCLYDLLYFYIVKS